MGKTSEMIQSFYERYKKIVGSYEESTDWNQKLSELRTLKDDIQHYKIRDSKNASFFTWCVRNLNKEITDEMRRVYHLSVRD